MYYTYCKAVDWAASEGDRYIVVKHGVTPEQANETLDDPDAVEFDPDYNSKSGQSVRTVGYSPSAQAIITVITVKQDGGVFGASAWRSNAKDLHYYENREMGDMAGMSKKVRDLIAEEAEAGEADQTPEPVPPHAKVTRGNPRSKVLQVRLKPDEIDALERIAARRELPVSTIAREHLLKLIADDHASSADRLLQLVNVAAQVQSLATEMREDLQDRLSVYKREGKVLQLDRVIADLGLGGTIKKGAVESIDKPKVRRGRSRRRVSARPQDWKERQR